jgi:hypothetical protein
MSYNWISVNDAMPPGEEEWPGIHQSIEVLVVTAEGIHIAAFREYRDEDEAPSAPWPGWQLQGCDSYQLDGVTHWALLPAPPVS